MKQHFLTIGILLSVFLAIMTVILLAAKHSKPSDTTANQTATPLLDLPSTGPGGGNGETQGTNTNQANAIKGAVEIDASQSAATASARKAIVTLTSGKSFEIILYPDLAPNSVANFIKKSQSGFYNGLLFFRVEKDKQTGSTLVVQTGDPTNTGQGGGTMPAEYNKKPFTVGSVGIARGQNRDVNSDSQFFIATSELPNLNGEYTNMGDVISGIDVVSSLHQGQPIKNIQIEN